MAELKFEILQEFGTLSTSKSGWELQLNFVQWGDNQPKFDLRTWSPDHKKMGKGLTLTHDEVVKLSEVLGGVLNAEKTGQANAQPIAQPEDLFEELPEEENETPGWGKLGEF